ALWLAEGQLALGQRSEARALLETVVTTTHEKGYRHLEGAAERVLAEALGPVDPETPGHVARAALLLEEVGARNDVAKLLVAQARIRQAAGDYPGARVNLEQALAIFTELGTVDGPRLVASLLQSLPDGADASTVHPGS